MSYLAPLRLHFAGEFEARVTTANNEADRLGTPQRDGGHGEYGTGEWLLRNCRVTAAFDAAGDGDTTAAFAELPDLAAPATDHPEMQNVLIECDHWVRSGGALQPATRSQAGPASASGPNHRRREETDFARTSNACPLVSARRAAGRASAALAAASAAASGRRWGLTASRVCVTR